MEWKGWGEIQCVGNIWSLSTAAWSCEGETCTWRREETSRIRRAVWEPTNTPLSFYFLSPGHRSTQRRLSESKIGKLSNFFFLFCSIFQRTIQILLLMSAWLHPLPRPKQGIWLLFVFSFAANLLLLHVNALGNAKLTQQALLAWAVCSGLWFLSKEIFVHSNRFMLVQQ